MKIIRKIFIIAFIFMIIGASRDSYALRVPIGDYGSMQTTLQKSSLYTNPNYIKAIKYRNDLLSGIMVDEEAIREVFYNLAPLVFSPKGLAAFNKVNDFYNRLKTSSSFMESLLQDSDRIALDYLAKLPSIAAVFPAGQFYCNMYDPVARRFLAFMQLARGEIDEFTYLRRDLPDYDFIHVLELPEDARLTLQKDADEEVRVFFAKMLKNNPHWASVAEGLLKDFKISSIKLTSSVQERENTVEEFTEKGTIALCLGNPIPVAIWNNLHLFICDGDYRFVNPIRDLMIGLGEPIYAKQHIDRTIPRAFQINYLLNQIKESGPQDIEGMLKIVFEEVSKTMPERPRHGASIGLVDFSRQHWKETFRIAEESGLIKKGKGGLFELTEKGDYELNNILMQRDKFLEQHSLIGEKIEIANVRKKANVLMQGMSPIMDNVRKMIEKLKPEEKLSEDTKGALDALDKEVIKAKSFIKPDLSNKVLLDKMYLLFSHYIGNNFGGIAMTARNAVDYDPLTIEDIKNMKKGPFNNGNSDSRVYACPRR